MRRRGFLTLAAGLALAAGCDAGDGAGPGVKRLFVLEPTADGHGWDGIAGRLSTVLVQAGLVRTAMAVEWGGALGSAPRDAFGAFHGPFAREGRLLVTAMPMVA